MPNASLLRAKDSIDSLRSFLVNEGDLLAVQLILTRKHILDRLITLQAVGMPRDNSCMPRLRRLSDVMTNLIGSWSSELTDSERLDWQNLVQSVIQLYESLELR